MDDPKIYGGLVVYLIPLVIQAVCSVVTLIVAVWGVIRLSREHREMKMERNHAGQ